MVGKNRRYLKLSSEATVASLKGEKGDKLTKETKKPSQKARDSLTPEDHLEILRQLYLARYFDVRLVKEKRRGRLRGTLYSSHNQEAILVGTLFGLRPEDWISPIHRDMPAFFLKDMRAGWDNPKNKKTKKGIQMM
jgi:TPP-dependent pyruvate/acetoin dehydrogenase alpha subunit